MFKPDFGLCLFFTIESVNAQILCLPLAPRLFDMATDIKDKTALRHVEALSSKLRRRYAGAISESRSPLTVF
jgi:hypothetical protein